MVEQAKEGTASNSIGDSGKSGDIGKRRRLSFGWRGIDRLASGVGRKRRMQLIVIFGVIIVFSVFILSFMSARFEAGEVRIPIAFFILTLFIVSLLFAGLVSLEIVFILRQRQVEGPTQKRLITLFMLMALTPTVLMAIFSTVVLNFGVENWFSARVRSVVDSSYETAVAYRDEHDLGIEHDGAFVYNQFELYYQQRPELRPALVWAMELARNGIVRGYVIGPNAEIVARGPRSYLFDYNPPTDEEMERALKGETVIIHDPEHNEYRYLRPIMGSVANNLYLVREVDGEILALLNSSEKTSQFYRDSEKARQDLLFSFGAFYLGISTMVLMLAIWAAIYFSSNMTRPIGRLARAAQKISAGDLSARVIDSGGADEFSLLSRTFNQMADDVQSQQIALKKAGQESESERLRFNRVLEGVSSGVIGVDREGGVNFINSSAMRLLQVKDGQDVLKIDEVAPEFVEAWRTALEAGAGVVQEQIILIRGNSHETVFLKATPSEQSKQGQVILSFDVVSDLVQAQRMAAWGDVARRIAHEIKNPLTPIRLSAERINRRFSRQIETDREKFEELTSVIVRQTQDIQRIVDEFARFSRMPEAEKTMGDWIGAIKDAITLQENNSQKVKIRYEGVETAHGFFDPTQLHQALNNLLKNGIESIEARKAREPIEGEILIRGQRQINGLEIEIIDNGIGFPSDKTRLFEPYMTLKETGTGLGLPIVKKIIEDHDGRILLTDREDNEKGARILIRLSLPSINNVEE